MDNHQLYGSVYSVSPTQDKRLQTEIALLREMINKKEILNIKYEILYLILDIKYCINIVQKNKKKNIITKYISIIFFLFRIKIINYKLITFF